jgi:hypothetical protein
MTVVFAKDSGAAEINPEMPFFFFQTKHSKN